MLKVNTKISVNSPPKIKKRNGKKEITQIISPKAKATTNETAKICFLLFKPNNSPFRLLIKSPFQKIKNENTAKRMNPAKNPTAWANTKNQIKLAAKNIKIGDINKKFFGAIFILYIWVIIFCRCNTL